MKCFRYFKKFVRFKNKILSMDEFYTQVPHNKECSHISQKMAFLIIKTVKLKLLALPLALRIK